MIYLLPAPPKPATARPKIRKFTLGATPQKRDPISNHNTDAKLCKVNNANRDVTEGENTLDIFAVKNREQCAIDEQEGSL